MKYLYVLLSLFLPFTVIAQTITVGTVTKTTLCLGDTIWVRYSAIGSFKADNFFAAQLSDENGSFATFTNIGHDSTMQDSIPVLIGKGGDYYRLRVIGTDPYTISGNTSPEISVVNFPTPNPFLDIKVTSLGPTSFIGKPIQFTDAKLESAGSEYYWAFDQDASILWTTTASPTITYSSDGDKSGRLTVTNSAGCSTTKPFYLRILSCSPVIPDTVHTVTGSESGSYAYVWVKAGGNYTVLRETYTTVFVETGASLILNDYSTSICYLKKGSSFAINGIVQPSTVVLSPGDSVTLDHYGRVDTIYCDNLQFDYSKVGGNEAVPVNAHPLQILNFQNSLQISDEGIPISVAIFNLLGNEITSKTDVGMLSLDLSSLSDGVYFAVITAGNRREVRKIVVVH